MSLLVQNYYREVLLIELDFIYFLKTFFNFWDAIFERKNSSARKIYNLSAKALRLWI
jgi:hypothetical protein